MTRGKLWGLPTVLSLDNLTTYVAFKDEHPCYRATFLGGKNRLQVREIQRTRGGGGVDVMLHVSITSMLMARGANLAPLKRRTLPQGPKITGDSHAEGGLLACPNDAVARLILASPHSRKEKQKNPRVPVKRASHAGSGTCDRGLEKVKEEIRPLWIDCWRMIDADHSHPRCDSV